MNLLDTSPVRIRAKEIQAVQMHAQQLVDWARQHGLVVTITLKPEQPLAMGNYMPVIDIREARNGE
ncbi:hypothetical protein LJR099_003083 [Variovorax paradoxus]|uniref:hypothetical protein n=1 Tax=Variovorax paradoxus TaxID=34073 RepID=UPI00399B207B